MTTHGRKVFTVISISLLLALSLPSEAAAATECECVIAYVYPVELKPGDVVSDGKHGRSFEIQSDTLLIWVDLLPPADFVHPTKYIFIRDHETRPVLIFDGEWWPYLNGNSILYSTSNRNCSLSPYKLDGIEVHIYPVELRKDDVVSDGGYGASIRIECDTLFVWVDLMPTARFAHPTKHIFIRSRADHPVIAADGQWWPYLNGQGIFYGSANTGALVSPLRLSCEGTTRE